jgi:hypothetical protein
MAQCYSSCLEPWDLAKGSGFKPIGVQVKALLALCHWAWIGGPNGLLVGSAVVLQKKQKQKPCARTNLGEKSVWFYPHPFYFSSLWNVQYLSPLWFHPQTGAQLWVLFTHNCLLVMSKWNVQVSLMKSKCNVQSSLVRSVMCIFLWWWVDGMCNWWKLFQYWKSTDIESS